MTTFRSFSFYTATLHFTIDLFNISIIYGKRKAENSQPKKLQRVDFVRHLFSSMNLSSVDSLIFYSDAQTSETLFYTTYE